MEIQLSLSNVSTLGRLPLTLIQICCIDWKLCLEQLNAESQLGGKDECEDDSAGEYLM